jgi:hypothetical protein
MQPIEIRQPQLIRVAVLLFGIGWCAFVGTMAVETVLDGDPIAIAPVLLLAFGVVLVSRLVRVRVVAEVDRLVVRNMGPGGTVLRGEIQDISVDAAPFPVPMSTTSLVLSNGKTLRLDALGRTFLPGDGRRVANDVAKLQAWLHPGA